MSFGMSLAIIANGIDISMASSMVLSSYLSAPYFQAGNYLVGILVAIFQAVTQIHEQSLSFILKLIVVIIVLLVGGGWMLETLMDFTRYLFTLM